MLHRTQALLKCFLTGIVDDLPREILEQRAALWKKLSRESRKSFMEGVEERSASRRRSMYETATRSNYLGVIYAFVVAAGVAALVASDTHGASEVLLKTGVSLVIIAGCILILAIAAKAKVWKKARKGGFSEADEMLREAVRSQEAAKADSEQEDVVERDRAFLRLHKRKIILLVERRAQHIAAVISIIGMIMMLIGICLR